MTGKIDSHVGRWTTVDGRMSVDLAANGSFHEVRNDTGRAYHGTYRIHGSRIQFHDPITGYEATGELRGDVMLADGCEFRKV